MSCFFFTTSHDITTVAVMFSEQRRTICRPCGHNLSNPQRQREGGEGGDIARSEGDGQGFTSLGPQSPPVCHLQPVATRFPGCPWYPLSCVMS